MQRSRGKSDQYGTFLQQTCCCLSLEELQLLAATVSRKYFSSVFPVSVFTAYTMFVSDNCRLHVGHQIMPGFHHSVAVFPLPFRRSRCRFRTPLPLLLPLPLRIFLLFTAETESNFLLLARYVPNVA